ncbi:Xyloglucan endotransglucosylase/hydrolase [Quillaja saponaria]|uniref:Xyloglucan endotransglucosylase/hydrolase n=1 Tax=Quillaja saponaria TaxID=32244 RepID=A0AAD7Q6D5_QUISA|nr:Xyloglucan endotransglucosylase/hydrolase [Quillaja saponaria]
MERASTSLEFMAFCLSSALLLNLVICANFTELFQPYWAPDHIVTEGDLTKLTLDNVSGCGFESKSKFLFGKASLQIKLVEGDSAGTVTTFYMSSEGPIHDELDFEFLGNTSGEPYLVQTNVYTNGTGNREQRHTLWFDPTADFHTYSLFWNRHYIVFLVDNIPIRVFINKEKDGVPYPTSQAMTIRGSVWNADDWATQGGRVKTNWSHAPFVSAFRSFEIDACELLPEADDTVAKCSGLRQFWWDKPSLRKLDRHRNHQLKWVRARHMVYDYCKDTGRFTELPRECIK